MLQASRPVPGTSLLRSILFRVLLFSLGWWVLAEGALGGWYLALPTIIAAVVVSFALVPLGAWRWRMAGLLRFVPFFLLQSIVGGIDVARRALHPRLRIRPGFLRYPLRLPEGPAQVFFATTLSLLPGTLSVQIEKTHLQVHVLDRGDRVEKTLRELEERVAALFGAELPTRTHVVDTQAHDRRS